MKKQSAKYSALRRAANVLRKYGEGGDTVLAHISPMEAEQLGSMYGSDTNPHTGLPQYGLFRRIERAIRKPAKKILPIAGSMIGGIVGGPAGAIAGGALGGGLSSKRHPLDHALGGAMIGLGHSMLSPSIAKGLNLDPGSFASKALMGSAPSLGEQLGIGSGLGLLGMGDAAAPAAASAMGGTSASGLSGGAASLGLGSGLLDTALLATAITGFAKRKVKTPPYGSPENETINQAIERNRPQWGPEHEYKPAPPLRGEPKFPPRGYRRTAWNFFPTPEEQIQQMTRVQEEMAEPGYQYRYAKGGHVRYYKGAEGGQSDKRPVKLPEHSYIMDATTVSLAGDGNSENGKKRIVKEIVENFLNSGITKESKPSRNIKAFVSDGEMEISPQIVKAAGGGDINKGVKVFDKFRKNMRKHKGVNKFLPPKSKPLMQYMR